MRRRAPRPLGPALERVTARMAPATPLAEVQRVWADVVGPAVAAHATPAAERAGVLTVDCRAAVWAQELELLGPELCARINARLGRAAVSAMRCRTGAARA